MTAKKTDRKPWCEVNKKLLMDWWDEGYSAQEISKKFEKMELRYSRSAILGKIFRIRNTEVSW